MRIPRPARSSMVAFALLAGLPTASSTQLLRPAGMTSAAPGVPASARPATPPVVRPATTGRKTAQVVVGLLAAASLGALG